MPGWRATWMRFWLEPTTPFNLGACRALSCGAFLLIFWRQDSSGWADVSTAFWMPPAAVQHLEFPVLSGGLLRALQWTWKLALGLSCVGLFTRLSTTASCVLGVYLLGLPHHFGRIHHRDAIVVLVLATLALSRSGDAWSLDRLVAKVRRGADSGALPMSGEYRWPVCLVQVLVTLVFFGAGVSKLRQSGLEWIFSDNVRLLLLERRRPLGLWVARHSWLCRLIAGATVVGELCAPLAVVNRLARAILIPGLFVMQIGIYVMMGTGFKEFMVVYLFWVPWDRVCQRLTARWDRARGRGPAEVAAS